jgi:protein-disulfide isomerase
MAAKAGRRRSRKVAIIVISVLAALSIAAAVLVGATLHSKSAVSGKVVLPTGITSPTGPVVVGSPTAATKIDLWEDFRCPACRQFEQNFGKDILTGIKDGKIQVNFHMLSFLTLADRTASRRAANAGFAAYDLGGQDAFLAFHTWAYRNQPEETVDGFFAEDLAALGSTLPVKDVAAYKTAVRNMKFGGFVDTVNNSMQAAGIQGTPTVVVGGKTLDLSKLSPAQVLAAMGLSK